MSKKVQKGLEKKVEDIVSGMLNPNWSPELGLGDFADRLRLYFYSQPVVTNLKIIKNILYDANGSPYPAVTVEMRTTIKAFDSLVWDTMTEIAEGCNCILHVPKKVHVRDKVIDVQVKALRRGDDDRVVARTKKKAVYHG